MYTSESKKCGNHQKNTSDDSESSTSEKYFLSSKSSSDCPIHKTIIKTNRNNFYLKTQKQIVPTWKVNYLVSNQSNKAPQIDPVLMGAWGIAINNNLLWVCNAGSDTITSYDMFGNKFMVSILTRDDVNKASYPAGISFNNDGYYTVTNGNNTQTVELMVSTEHSTVHAYNKQISQTNAPIVINTKTEGIVSVFRGILLMENKIYLADLFQREIDVYDNDYNKLTGFSFVDQETSDPIPSDYGPNNIVSFNGYIYVIWARKTLKNPLQAISGPGTGFVSIFNFDGSFVRRFTSRGVLNNPWGAIMAPCECGIPKGSILIANHGDGLINIFDSDGGYIGPLLTQYGKPLKIDGLRGLASNYKHNNEIFFTASSPGLTDGLLGMISKDDMLSF
jgi:uncharacterized protein (TIGR03118 family)